MSSIGYARVSTHEQETDLQTDALTTAGCSRIFIDRASGAADCRPALEDAMAFLRKGDVLVVWKIDRLARTMSQLVNMINDLNKRGIEFRSVTEAIDTRSPSGQLLFHLVGAMAQFERDLIRERTLAGLRSARKRGRLGGRPASITSDVVAKAKAMQDQGFSVREAALILRVGKSSLYKVLAHKSPANAMGAPAGHR